MTADMYSELGQSLPYKAWIQTIQLSGWRRSVMFSY